jgi:hypothetical protein
MMYDCYIIVGEEFRNVIANGEVIGFQIGLRIPFYSSVFLSMVGETEMKVDGESFTADQMTVTLRGKNFQKTKLEDEPYEKWEFGEVGIVTVAKPGGLQPGDHSVDVRQQVLIGFVEGGLYGHDNKVLHLES